MLGPPVLWCPYLSWPPVSLVLLSVQQLKMPSLTGLLNLPVNCQFLSFLPTACSCGSNTSVPLLQVHLSLCVKAGQVCGTSSQASQKSSPNIHFRKWMYSCSRKHSNAVTEKQLAVPIRCGEGTTFMCPLLFLTAFASYASCLPQAAHGFSWRGSGGEYLG